MRQVSSYRSRLAAGLSLLGLLTALLVPLTGTALAAPTPAAGGTNGQFCTGLTNRAAETTGKITALNGKVTQAWAAQDQKLASDEQAVDQKVAGFRSQADATRATDFSKLAAKATTTAEQQAVQTYETAVLKAIDSRRAAYDSARQTFRDSLKNLLAAHRSTVTAQINGFLAAVNGAFSTAEAACSAPKPDAATIRQAMVASLQSARQTFQGDRQADSKLGPEVKQLAATRDAAFQQADSTFKAAMTAAQTALKTAFGTQAGKV